MVTVLWVALAACEGGTDDPTDDTDPGTHFEVLRDCAATVGDICPVAGTGDAGFNGEGRHALDSWMSFPMSITYSPYGRPIIADWNNHRLREVQDDGTLVTIMGTNFLGDGDFEQRDQADGALGTTVNLNHPTQQRYFSSGVLLSASWHTHKLRLWEPLTGMVRVLAGTALGFNPVDEVPGEVQSAVGMQLNQPRWVEIDSQGDVFILDMRNQRIRKLGMAGFEIETVAGSGRWGIAGTGAGDPDNDCSSTNAWETCFAFPFDDNPEPGGAMQFSADETLLYIADSQAHIIRVLDLTTHEVTVLAGAAGEKGDVDGVGAAARFDFPSSLALDREAGVLFVADTNNHKVRAVDVATGEVTTFAGNGDSTCPHDGSAASAVCDEQPLAGDGGPALDATLFRPFGVDLDLNGDVVIADTYNHRFRVVYR
jgi:DNA-binding beta-propeller fold protein YncE